MAKGEKAESANIEAIRHKDKRKNIPTEELRDFVAEYEAKPKVILYPRDSSLDPQLVWKGKDEQDSKELEVPAVPVYIQEKIHPKHLIEDLRAQAKRGKPAQLDLFADFNGIEFEDMVEFYQHEQNWSNRMILGDSLLVMTSLAEREGLKGKVQMVYVDPPYGIKFGSNWQVSTRKRDVKDGSAQDATRQPEQIKAFRDTWKLGIHSYLAYLRDRLVMARELLTETGSVFVQMGDENVHLVRCVMDEVFGSENFIASIVFVKTSGFSAERIDNISDFLLWYAKNKELTKYRQLYLEKEFGEQGMKGYDWIELSDGTRRRLTAREKGGLDVLPSGSRLFKPGGMTSQGRTSTGVEFDFQGTKLSPDASSHWKTTIDGMRRLQEANRLILVGNTLSFVRFADEFPIFPITNVWTDTGIAGYGEPKIFVVQTNPKVV
jgi:adenine-specific DNA-methyltransferase